MAGAVFKKVVTKLTEKMPDPFESVYPMSPASLIVSVVESSNRLPRMGTSNAPHVLPRSDRARSDCNLFTLVALSL